MLRKLMYHPIINTTNRFITHTILSPTEFTKIKVPSSKLLPLADYNPSMIEAEWYKWWEENELFKPNKKATLEPFTMCIPPPNVTGSLHIGHALTNTLQDVIIRYKRMKGHEVIWVPGLDHAGIATQTVVEKDLFKNKKLTRHDLGREEFIKLIWKWKDSYGGRINSQLRQLGVSLDWSKSVFTLDDERYNAVITAFIDMYNQGLIYRSHRMVHWCCELRSTISDIEVDTVSFPTPAKYKLPNGKNIEVGLMHRIVYDCFSKEGTSIGSLTVSTTRPETIIGDLAIAIHPKDDRYIKFQGAFAKNPVTDELIPIICDDLVVDMKLGTGVLKVTPAHDHVDYQVGKRHNLGVRVIFDDKGTVIIGKYKGLDRFHARVNIIKDLGEKYLGSIPHAMNISVCSRTGDIIEPMIKPQWFISCDKVNDQAIKLVKEEKIKFIPELKDEWTRWLTNAESKSWCISRQLWWGHRIPAYKIVLKGEAANLSEEESNERWVAALDIEGAKIIACNKYNLKIDQFDLFQDEDVLDTWFSSGIFPLSIFGWPRSTEELKRYYPLSVMITGKDIQFFWVARMVMMCNFLVKNSVPFPTAILHPLIRGSDGKKMSKSSGNIIDPCELMEGRTINQLLDRIKSSNLAPNVLKASETALKKEFPNGMVACGADALRLALVGRVNMDNFIALDNKKVIESRKISNKIWNAAKFVLFNVGTNELPTSFSTENLPLPHAYILHKLALTVQSVNDNLNSYSWRQTADALTSFLYDDFCDVFLEFSKIPLKNNAHSEITMQVLLLCINTFLKLLHPIMPFLTEELWQHLPSKFKDSSSIMTSSFPESEDFTKFKLLPESQPMHNFSMILHFLSNVRSYIASKSNKRRIDSIIIVKHDDCSVYSNLVEAYVNEFALLLRTTSESFKFISEAEFISNSNNEPLVLDFNSAEKLRIFVTFKKDL